MQYKKQSPKKPKAQLSLSTLNDSQKKAVLHTNGPLLVLAGAGSGKTRVLTTRIARLIHDAACKPENILAITFTNKAAREMRERVSGLMTRPVAEKMTVSTFHSLGARILREHGDRLGFKKQFSIMDEGDRLATLRRIMRTMGTRLKETTPEECIAKISRAKNVATDPVAHLKESDEPIKLQRLARYYGEVCAKHQLVDFDDLLLLPLRLLENHADVLEEYRKRYTFISIDEFQDTNDVQMRLALLLSAPRNNLMVVGDDDQSIYSWRGANISHILTFTDRFADATRVILDVNYRSTRTIVDAASAIIGINKQRTIKNVKSSAGTGEVIIHYKGDDELDEAIWVARTIANNVQTNKMRFADHALLLRTNAIMRRFEEELRRGKIPYKTVGATSYFERREIKDVLAYLRFFANPHDEASLTRMIKVPDKGISATTLSALDDLAGDKKIGLWEALRQSHTLTTLTQGQRDKCHSFVEFCDRHAKGFADGLLSRTLRLLLDESGYREYLKKATGMTDEERDRFDNVEEIIHGLELFEQKFVDSTPSVALYLQELALLASDDREDKEESAHGVTIMTVHKAKGLEFPAVFVVALDNTVFPSPQSIAEGGIEEERRLFYVAMTRARTQLYLTYPGTKLFRGKAIVVTPSVFLREIPQEYMDGALGEKDSMEYQNYVSGFVELMQAKLNTIPAPDMSAV